jgi:serine O-acetyltransferase
MKLLDHLHRDLEQLASIAGEHYARGGGGSLWKLAIHSDSYAITALGRLREGARRCRVPGVNHALRLLQTGFYGIELGNEVTLGHGVWFIHPTAIVIGGNAKIGDRVRFFGSNTVGTAKENGYPTIEDDVWVGAGARILGPVRIGKGARIGANAVVLTDVPPGAVAVGIPAKIKAAP